MDRRGAGFAQVAQRNTGNHSGSPLGSNQAGLPPSGRRILPGSVAAVGTAGGPRNSSFGPPPGVSPPGLSPSEQHATHHSSDPSNVFPYSPYQLLSDLSFANSIRQYHLGAPTGQTTTVASSKFAHFSTVYNIDASPMPSALCPTANVQAYRSTNRFNGKQVLLRRIVNAKATPALCAEVADAYKHFRHPSLVQLLSVTHTSEFVLGFVDVIAEYRFVKGAVRAIDLAIAGQVSEAMLWSVACQLVSLVRLFHEFGSPLRGLHSSKILYVEISNRALFSGLGLQDLMEAAGSLKQGMTPEAQEMRFREDVQNLGTILIQLACKNPTATSFDAATSANFTAPFIAFCNCLREGRLKIGDICRSLGERLALEVGNQAAITDFMLAEGAKEVHNGRLLNMLVKLNLAAHTAAAEGSALESDHVAIRLFLQYLFQQVDESNRPRHDLGHVYFALNKLDSASDELIQLVGMDSDSMILVVSFRDLKVALENICKSTMMADKPPENAGSAAVSAPPSGASPV